MQEADPVTLLSFIKEFISLEELKTLCFNLYVQFDDLVGEGREAKARELIVFMQNRGRLIDLAVALARERPSQYRQKIGLTPIERPTNVPQARNPRQVFISHAHQDAEFAFRLANDLRHQNYKVWIAPESIPIGERWVEAINHALRESGIFLLVSTPYAVVSEWVQEETNYAIELATTRQIRFIRLDVQRAEVPPLWTVRQHVTFRQEYSAGLGRLIEALEEPGLASQHEQRVPKTATTAKSETIAERQLALPVVLTQSETITSSPRDLPAASEDATLPTTSLPAGFNRPSPPAWGFLIVMIMALVVLAIWASGTFRGFNIASEMDDATRNDVPGFITTAEGLSELTQTPVNSLPVNAPTWTVEPSTALQPPITMSKPSTSEPSPRPNIEPKEEETPSTLEVDVTVTSVMPQSGPTESFTNTPTRILEVASTPNPTFTSTFTPTPTPTPSSTPSSTPTTTPTPTQTVQPNSTPTVDIFSTPQAGDIRVVLRGWLDVEQVYVPAGSFQMGTVDGDSDERPVHEVILHSFWIDRTEVTNSQFVTCTNARACERPNYLFDQTESFTRSWYRGSSEYKDYPVVQVDWNDAYDYCEWVGGRLPTEAEWEYAARGPESSTYPWGDDPPTCRILNFANCIGDTSEVGSYPNGASWVGAVDMAGNVLEWVNDWYDSVYYSRSPQENPSGRATGDERVVRGDSWSNFFPADARSANRLSFDPNSRNYIIGFRCVQD